MSFVSLALSAPLSWLLMGLGRRLGHVDRPGGEGHKGHAREVPNTGGIAIFIAVAAPVVAALACAWSIDADQWHGFLSPVAEHLQGLRRQTVTAAALVVALTLLHFLGVIDDRRGLGPGIKLLVELIVAGTLAGLFGVRIFQFLETGTDGQVLMAGVAASTILSTIWMVAITNSINMLDNMDGLAGGVGTIIAGLYLAATLIGGQWFVAALCALLLGALIGFLLFNYPRARLFMGDGGSLLVGMLLAVISIRTTYYEPSGSRAAASVPGASWYGVWMPLVVMAVPLYDMVSVSIVRLSQGRSPFVGDQNHVSHRLVRRGMKKHRAVAVIWLATAATGLGGVMFNAIEPWQALLVAGQSLAVIGLLACLRV